MCSHVESNVASFSPGFSKHCVVGYCNCLNCGATFRFLLNNSNHKLEVLSFHVVFTVKLYALFGLPHIVATQATLHEEARALAKKPDSM